MSRFTFVVLVILVRGSSACRRDLVNEMYPEDQAKIRKTLNDLVLAVNSRDVDRIETFHLYGPKFTKYETEPIARLDAAAARKLESDFFKTSAHIDISFQDLKVDVFGDVAIVTGVLDYKAEVQKTAVAGRDRMTMVLVKVGDDWKITHEHASPENPSPDKPH